jgi:hypothetical protein
VVTVVTLTASACSLANCDKIGASQQHHFFKMNKLLFGHKPPVTALTEADYIVFRAAKEGNMEMLQQGLALGGRVNAHG